MHPTKFRLVSDVRMYLRFQLTSRTKGVRMLFVSASLSRDLRVAFGAGESVEKSNRKTTIKKPNENYFSTNCNSGTAEVIRWIAST